MAEEPGRRSQRLECAAMFNNRLKEIFKIIKDLEKKAPTFIVKRDAAKDKWVYSIPTAADPTVNKYIYNYEALRTIEDLLESFEDVDAPLYSGECRSKVVDRLKDLFFVYDDEKRELKLANLKERLSLATHAHSSVIGDANIISLFGGRRSWSRKHHARQRRRTLRR